MANSCVAVNTPAFKAKVKQYGTSTPEMNLAIQSWLNKGNRWNSETESELDNYLIKYFNIGTTKQYNDKESCEEAASVWGEYNNTLYENSKEANEVYNNMVKCFGKDNVTLFVTSDNTYKINIAEPVLNNTVNDNNGKFSKENNDIRYNRNIKTEFAHIKKLAEEKNKQNRYFDLSSFNKKYGTNIGRIPSTGELIYRNPKVQGLTVYNPEDNKMTTQKRIDRAALLTYLANKFNLNIIEISNEEFNSKIGTTTNATIINDTVYVRKEGKELLSNEILIEEFLHPMVKAIYDNNKELSSKLLEEARKEFPELDKQIKALYTGKAEVSQDEELITQVLSKYLNKEISENGVNSRNLIDYIKQFFEKIFEACKDLFGKVEINKTTRLTISGKDIKEVFSFENLAHLINTKEISFNDTLGEIRRDNRIDNVTKLQESTDKFNAFRAKAGDLVKKGENFDINHTYMRYDEVSGKWVEVEKSVTKDITPTTHPTLITVKDNEFTTSDAIPSSTLGNTNDYVARKVFALRKNSTEYISMSLSNDSNVKNLTEEQLKELVSSIKSIINSINDKFGGENNWECCSDEVALLGKRTDSNGKDYYVAGTPDLILWDNTGKFYILDFKTVKNLTVDNSNDKLTQHEGPNGEFNPRNKKWFAQTTDYKFMIADMSNGDIVPESTKMIMASTLSYPTSEGYENVNGELKVNGEPITSIGNNYAAPKALMLYEFGPNESEEPFKLNEVNSFKQSEYVAKQVETLTPEEKNENPDLGSKNEIANQVEINVTKLNPISAQSKLRNIPAAERQFLSNFIFHKTSEIITELVNIDSEFDASDVVSSFILDYLGDIEVSDLKTREDVLNKVGLKQIFSFIQEYYFNTDNLNGNMLNTDLDDEGNILKKNNLDIAYECFKELCKMAYSKFIFYEGISIDDNIASDALSYNVGDELLKEEQEKALQGEKENEAWQVHFRNVSSKASLSGAVKRFLGNIPIKNNAGERIIDDYGYGLDTYVDADLVISKLQAWLANCETYESMMEVLEKQKEGYPWVNSMLEVLDNDTENPIKQQFFQNFRKDFTTYSVVYKEWDKTTKKYNYKINIINTKGAEQAIIDVLKANFEMYLGQKVLSANSEKELIFNKDVINRDKTLLSKYASDNTDNPFSRTTTPDIEHFKSLYEALVDLGIPRYVLTYKDFINAFVKKSTIENEMAANKMMKEIAGSAATILKELDNIKKGPFSPIDSNSTIQKAYYKIIKNVADFMDDAIESSTYENGKMYYSYCNPSFMGKMVRNLRDANNTYTGTGRNKNAEFQNSEFGKYVIENYGKYKFFRQNNDNDIYVKINPNDPRIWGTEWLEDLVNDREGARTSVLDHKVQLTFDKDDYTELDELHELVSLVTEYFNNGNEKMGWFRVPMLANKPSNEFIRFLKKTNVAYVQAWNGKDLPEYKNDIIKGLFGTFQQEIMRIRTLFERASNNKLSDDKIKNFDIPNKVLSKLEKESDGTIKRNLNNLRILIKNNGSNPNGISFQYLTLFNDVLMSDNKDNPDIVRMQNYLIEKIGADENNTYNGIEVKDGNIQGAFVTLVNKWINDNYEKDKKEWRKIGLFEEVEDNSKNKINKLFGMPNSEFERKLENFYWNDMFASINIIQLTVTDLSFNKNVEDFQKRFAQVHAPSLRYDTSAKYKGIKVADTNGQKAYHRTMTLADSEVKSEMIPFVDNIFTELEQTAISEGERSLIKTQKENIKKSLNKVNVADAQGLTCPTAYRKKMIMMGEWNDTLEAAYLKIKSGDFKPEDIKPLLLQPLKPFVYTKINKQTGVDTLSELPIPVQNKNSEYMLFVAGAMAQSGRLKDSKIAGIYEFMEEESAFDHNVYNGIGIDTIQFESAVKSGLQGAIDISDEAIKKFKEKEGNPNMSDKEAVRKILENAAYYNPNTISIEGNTGSTGRYNMTYVHEVPFEDYGIQQNVPAHFQDHEQAMGSQIRILNPSDLTGTDYVVGKEKLSAEELRDRYFKTAAENIRISIDELKNDFLLDSSVREKAVKDTISKLLNRDALGANTFNREIDNMVFSNLITKGMGDIIKENFKEYTGKESNTNTIESVTKGVNFEISDKERTNILYDLIKTEILKDGKYGYDMLQAISLNEDGNFNIPLCDSTQTVRIQQMLNSIIKSRINKQKIKGGPVVQASVFGQTEDLYIRLEDSNGVELDSYSEYMKKYPNASDSEYKKYLKDHNAKLKHFEIFVTCPSEELENLLISKAKKDNKDLFYYLDNPQEAVDLRYIPEDMLRMIGYRIPTEDKYSMQPCKVKGFLPRSAGEVVMLPKEITWMSGSDFDIDKLYVETKTFDFKDGIFWEPIDAYDKNNNDLFEMQWGVLTNPDTLPKMFNPGGFDMQKASVRRLEIMEAVNTGALKIEDINIEGLTANNLWETLEKLSLDDLDEIIADNNVNKRNIIFASTQVYFHKQNMTSGKLIGIFANNNTSHSFVNIHNNNPKNEKIKVNFKDKGFTINGVPYGDNIEIDGLYSNDGVTYISKVIASYLAASVDAVKDPVLNKMNLNTLTTGPAMLLTRLGVDSNTIGLLLRQPIIMYVTREYFKANSDKFARIEDVIDNVCEKLGNSVVSTATNINLNNADLAKNIGIEVVYDIIKDDNGNELARIEVPENSSEVLSLFKTLCSAATDLNDLTFCTKFNSMTNVAGPKISDTQITVNRVNSFFDKVKQGKTIFNTAANTIIEGNEMLKAFYSAFETGGVIDQMFQGYFPQYSDSYKLAVEYLAQSLPKGLKLNNDVLDKLSDFMSVFRMIGNGVINIDRKKYNYYISQSSTGFISKVNSFKEKLSDNKLVSMLEITPSSKRCTHVTVNIKGGGLSSDQQDEIKTAWSSLIESENEEERIFGVELAEYFMIRGGFGFNPKTVMHLMPVELKLAINNYREVMAGKSVVNGQLTDAYNWDVNETDMLYQFVRNMASVRKLSYKILPKPNITKEHLDSEVKIKGDYIYIKEASDIYNELGENNLWFEYNNLVALSTGKNDYSDSDGSYKEYMLIDKLGIGNNFIEVYPDEGYGAKSLFNSGEGKIDAEFVYSSDESDSGEKINDVEETPWRDSIEETKEYQKTQDFKSQLYNALKQIQQNNPSIEDSTIETIVDKAEKLQNNKC